MTRLVDFLVGFLSLPLAIWRALVDFIFSFGEKAVEWVEQFLTVVLPEMIARAIPQTLIDFMNQDSITNILDLVGDVFWFFPIIPILVIYSSAYTIMVTVRIVRYVIGFIPTVEG